MDQGEEVLHHTASVTGELVPMLVPLHLVFLLSRMLIQNDSRGTEGLLQLSIGKETEPPVSSDARDTKLLTDLDDVPPAEVRIGLLALVSLGIEHLEFSIRRVVPDG